MVYNNVKYLVRNLKIIGDEGVEKNLHLQYINIIPINLSQVSDSPGNQHLKNVKTVYLPSGNKLYASDVRFRDYEKEEAGYSYLDSLVIRQI